MNPLDLNNIATQFYNAGVNYSAAIQPYALKRVITESCGSDAHMKKAAYPSA
jgi:hypothetical protein